MPGPPPEYPVSVRGQLFPSVRVCAEHFNLSTDTVYWMVSKGRADSIGIGRGKSLGNKNTKNHSRNKPVTLAGRTFQSRAQVDKYLDRYTGYTKKALAAGRRAEVEAAVLHKQMKEDSLHANRRNKELWFGNT